MINFEAFFKVTYGLYIVAAGDKAAGNGYISNTVFQVTSEPARFATCCNKDNYTSNLIEKHAAFSVSVLHQESDPKVYGKFGYRSGENLDKLAGMDIRYATTGTPIVLNDAIAFLECKVTQKIDLDTHWLFIGEVSSAEVLDDEKEAMTYAYYRNVKKGIAPKNAPTYIDKSKLEVPEKKAKKNAYKCLICGHIHDEAVEDLAFDNLPDDWQCPICGADKEDFELLEQ